MGAIVGVGGTYVFDVRKAVRARAEQEVAGRRERRRLRESVATALLQDMRRLEFDLREIYGAERPSTAVIVRPQLFYDALRADVRGLAAATIQAVAEFYRRIDHLYSAYSVLRTAGAGRISSSDKLEYELKGHAAFALQALPEAVAALRQEGGMIPGPVEWAMVEYPTVPPVPAPVFDDARARAETLEAR